MEGLYKGRLVAFIVLGFLLECSTRSEDLVMKLDGHWYVIYGDSMEMYGEAIYKNGKACFYSDGFGMRFRNYKILNDSILEIYNKDALDHERVFHFVDSLTMTQAYLQPNSSHKEILVYRKILESDISATKIINQDSLEINKLIVGYMQRMHEHLKL